MPNLDTPARAPSRIFSFDEAVPRRRPLPGAGTDAIASPLDQLVRTMHTVKTARFNAAERLERKHLVSVVALSVVSLYFVGLSVWQAVYAPILSEPTNRLITLVSIMSSICTLVLALIEAMNDYKIKAHHMQECALAVNDRRLGHVDVAHAGGSLEQGDLARGQLAADVALGHDSTEAHLGFPVEHPQLDFAGGEVEEELGQIAAIRLRVQHAGLDHQNAAAGHHRHQRRPEE